MSLLSCNRATREIVWFEQVKQDYAHHSSLTTTVAIDKLEAVIFNDPSLKNRLFSAFAGKQVAKAAAIFFITALVAIVAIMALTGTMGIAVPLFIPLAISAGSVTGFTLVSVAGFTYNRHKLIAQYRSVDHHLGTEGPPSESDFEPQATKPDFSENEQQIGPLTPTFFKSDEELEQLIKEGIPEEVYREPRSHAFFRNHPETAFEFYARAAACGHLEGIYDLGFCYLIGQGTESDVKKAAEHFERAATQGHVAAQYYLGKLHTGQGEIPKDWPVAFKWLQQVSESGDSFFSGMGAEAIGDYFNSTDDQPSAIKWYEKAIKQYALSPDSLPDGFNYRRSANIGECYEKMEKFDLAAQWYQTSFNQGNQHISYNLGHCYQKMKKFDLAIQWFEKTFNDGWNHAAYHIGECYAALGDVERAHHWNTQFVPVSIPLIS